MTFTREDHYIHSADRRFVAVATDAETAELIVQSLNMNTLIHSISPLVATERGVGFWDGCGSVLRTHFGDYLGQPREMRPATEVEATLFYSLRHQQRKQLGAFYDRRGNYSGD